jgi:hypothetical protein
MLRSKVQIMVCPCCKKEFFEDWRKKDKRLSELKFCSFNCSHSRNHSKETKQKISLALTKSLKLCQTCNIKLSYNNKSGFCKNCKKHIKRSTYVISWRKRTKEELVKLKGGKCEKCGYNKCISALEFHHLNPEEKDFGISTKNLKSLDKYKEEIKKCLLLCSNCHREEHEQLNKKDK